MHQIRFPLGFCPRPRWGAYSAPRNLLAVFREPTSKGREGKGERRRRKVENKGKWKGREEEGRGGIVKGLRVCYLQLLQIKFHIRNKR